MLNDVTYMKTKGYEEYFGEEGVAFYFDYPAVSEDCIIVLTHREFFEVVKERYMVYAIQNKESYVEICKLLETLGYEILK